VNGKGAGKLIDEDGNSLGRMDPATVGFGFEGTEEEEIHRGGAGEEEILIGH
jgi:hypothetical protein